MAKKGGGIGSRQHVSTPVRTGKPRQGVRERGVSQIGQQMGNHSTEHSQKLTKAVERVQGGRGTLSELGNSVALNVGKGGPGTGRDVYRTGFQAQHGPVAGNPRPQGRDILREFGPDSKR